jgi:hypothetical protein
MFATRIRNIGTATFAPDAAGTVQEVTAAI